MARVTYLEVRKRCLKKDEAIKPLYARVVTHAFSTGLVWLLQPFQSITPNQISTLSLFCAALSLPFLGGMTPSSVLTGALLIELYYIFDALDGQWARFTGKKSLSGAFLDYLGNYLIQPFLFFAIGWGMLQRTGNSLYVFLGFCGGFSSLWLIMMWDIRASIVLSALKHRRQAPASGEETPSPEKPAGNTSPTRAVFSWLHKFLVFPWLMNVITAGALISFLAAGESGDAALVKIMHTMLWYYAVTGPSVSLLMTSHWIFTGKIDRDPAFG